MKVKFTLPKREYCSGKKEMVSWRLPDTLTKELQRIADTNGYSLTDVTITALDQFVQWANASKSKK